MYSLNSASGGNLSNSSDGYLNQYLGELNNKITEINLIFASHFREKRKIQLRLYPAMMKGQRWGRKTLENVSHFQNLFQGKQKLL